MPVPHGPSANGHGRCTFAVQMLEFVATNIQEQAAQHALQPEDADAVARLAITLQKIGDAPAPQRANTTELNLEMLAEVSKSTCDFPEFPEDRRGAATPTNVHDVGGQDAQGYCQPGTDTRNMHDAQLSLRRTRQLAAAFNLADLNRNGRVGVEELRHCLFAIGTTKDIAGAFVKQIDRDVDGCVSREEFVAICEDGQFEEVVERMLMFSAEGRVIGPPSDRCMLSRTCAFRIAWDSILLFVLGIVSVLVPLSFGFEAVGDWTQTSHLDLAIDVMFLLDIVLNFRTGIYTAEGFEVLKARAVACHYLKGWFWLDVLSSVPYRYITEALSEQPRLIRLLKLGKILKSMKLIKLARLLDTGRYVAMWDRFEEASMSATKVAQQTVFKVFLVMFLLCHWLACFFAWAQRGCVDACDEEGVKDNALHQYTASLYWSFSTVTTVGYGDITPSTGWGRLCASISMIVGGAFYAYVVGNITNAVTSQTNTDRIYYERMSEVQTWLDFHHFPPHVRRRVRMYFAAQLQHQAPPDESQIINQLSPDLQSTLVDYMVGREVRLNPMFQGLPAGLVNRLIPAIQHVTAEENEHVVEFGELGYAMFIVTEGKLHKRYQESDSRKDKFLELGDSFGEEVLCGVGSKYEYRVIACTRSGLQTIPIVSLKREVPSVPILMDLLRRNYNHYQNSSRIGTRILSSKEILGGVHADSHEALEEEALLSLKSSLQETNARQQEISSAIQNLIGNLSPTAHRAKPQGDAPLQL